MIVNGYDPRTDKALSAACREVPLTEQDFLRMALACLDQGGLSLADLKKVEAIVEDYRDEESEG